MCVGIRIKKRIHFENLNVNNWIYGGVTARRKSQGGACPWGDPTQNKTLYS